MINRPEAFDNVHVQFLFDWKNHLNFPCLRFSNQIEAADSGGCSKAPPKFYYDKLESILKVISILNLIL